MVKKQKIDAPAGASVGYYIQRDDQGRIIAAYSTPQRGAPIFGEVVKETGRILPAETEGGEGVPETITVNEIVGYEPGPAEEWYEGEPEIYRPVSIESTLAERNRLLSESDWVVIRAMERGEEVPAEWRDYRDALRAIDEGTDLESLKWPDKPE